MIIKNEEELIEFIKDKTLVELIKFFKEYQIKPEEFNNFNDTLLYLVKHKTSFEIIKFIFEQQHLGNKQGINNIKTLLYSIENNDYKIAKLLLQSGAKIINENSASNNIIEYLIKVKKLNANNLFFVLNVTKDVSIITNEILFYLFSRVFNLNLILEKLFNFKFSINNDIIINTLLMYKNKIPMSNKNFQKYVSDNLKPVMNINVKDKAGDTLLLYAINSIRDIEEVQLLIKYAKENNIILNVNEKNNEGDFPLMKIFNKPDFSMKALFEILTKYARESNILLELNEKNNSGEYPLLFLIKMGCIRSFFNRSLNTIFEIFKDLLAYAKENNIILQLNGKDNIGNYPLLLAIKKKNDAVEFKKIVRLLIEYADEQNISLEMNEKNDEGESPLFLAAHDKEIYQLLLNHAKK